MGYARAGIEVRGVDIADQPDYPFPFLLGDALTVELAGFDFVHASPPCQRYSRVTPEWARDRWPDLVGPLRDRLRAAVLSGEIRAYVIENVPGAPMRGAVQVCGSAFGLGVERHRLFESNWQLAGTGCAHPGDPVHVYGSQPPQGVQAARDAMGIDWLPWSRLVEAIPPAYTEFLGRQLVRHARRRPCVTLVDREPSLSPAGKRHGPPADSVTSSSALSSVSSTSFRRFVTVGADDSSPTSRACRNPRCGEPIALAATGRYRRYCSQACRQAGYRARSAG